MENNVEAVDDQGSGWFEVKKKHRSSTKFSVRSWAGGFSGKSGSYHLNQLSLSGKGGNSHRKHGYQLPKRSSKPSTRGGGDIPSSSTVLNEDENLRHRPDDKVDKQDNIGGEFSASLHSPKGGDSQILLLKDNTDVVPKIKWGDLEDDVLVLHHQKHSGSDVNLANKGTNNLEAGKPGNNSPLLSDVSSGTSLQEIKMVATAANVDAFPDGISSLSNTDDLIEESHTDMIAVSSLDSEVQSVNGKINTPNDGSNCMEIINEHSITTDDEFHPTSPSCEQAGTEVKPQGCDVVSEVNQLTISDVSLTNRSSVRISHDSESIAPQIICPKLSGDAGIVVQPQVPLISPVDESEVSKLPDTNGSVGTAVISAVIPLELDKKSYPCETAEPEISKDSGMMVKLQLPVISVANESEMSDVPVAIESSSEKIIAQDSKSLVSEKKGSEVSIEGTSVDGKMQDELSKFRSMSALGQGEAGESKERFRERLWCFLFENLNRAVDELYLLCELECDIEQMKEAVLVLEEAASDFKELTTRVQEFENVKRSSSHLVDGAPITLKSDHRRPHALSWEVRRMTTSPHRAEILSSSLEAFKRIQQERAQMLAANNAKSLGLECSNQHHVSGESDLTASVNDSTRKLCPGNLDVERRNAEQGRSNKVTFVQNGRDPPFNVPISDVNSSKLPVRDSSATLAAGKSKREPEVEKLLHKREKTLLESTVDKNIKSSDHLKKQIPLSDKEKEKKNSVPWKSMDAWKEKRNWEAILSSPFRVSSRISHSPGMSRKSAERARILHDKLMTPEKKKKTALDLKKEAEEKHARAMRIRSELENERVQKLQRTSEKLNRVNEWQAERTMKLREGMYARHQRSESRHEAYLAQVARRAGDESSKVNEVRFITSLNEENKKLMLRQKLQDSELRRAEKLQVIKTKQKEDLAREEAVLERRKLIEAEKLQRLAEMQRKKEEAQIRREEERKASSAAREARTIEQLRRREERAKAQQEEAEMLAQKLAERLRESEQRRKYYLEQIRERASMDFRDQSSPLLRRSTNKEGQGRSTPPNCSEDYQEDGTAGTGSSALAIGNGTVQHSLKRRIKKIRQRLMALKYEFSEPPPENAGIGYRTAVGRAKFGRWLQELQRLRQARKEGAASIGLLTAEMIKHMEGRDPELQAARQAGLLDFIASALPASHASKPEACQVTIHLLKLLRVVLSAPVNRSYFLAQNLLPPIIPMLSAALENYIKIAASLNVPGSTNSSSSKASLESFESTSEILDNCIWTVATVIGHPGSDEREIQMRDGLLELLVAYQVIHRLRDLFALYDRPQVEGSPFPSSIPLSIHLLVILTYRPRTNWSIDWESSPMETMVGFDRVEGNLLQIANCSFPSPNITSSENYAPPLSALNGCTLVSSPNVSDERPLGEPYHTDKSESISLGKDTEKKPSTPVELDNANASIGSNLDDSKKGVIDEKNKNNLVITGAVKQRDEQLSTKQPIAFLLSAISETGLVSLPSLLTAVLLQANNKLSSEQGSYILPSNFEEVATGVLKVFNNLALLDITFMQRMLARPDLKMEFFHLMSFLLSHCTSKWKGASDQIGLLLLESLLLLGYFALFHSENQAVLRWGKSPTILHKVCDLPFVFFSDPELMPVLAGTLVAACYGCEQNKSVVQQELSMDMLLSLLRSCRTVQPPVLSHPAVENLPGEDILETNQQVSDPKKPQGDVPQKSNRYNGKNSRASSLGKGGAASSSSRIGKMRSQRDSKATKTIEEMAFKHNLLVPEASVMLHYRFPSSFLDRAERFFSAGMVNMGAAV